MLRPVWIIAIVAVVAIVSVQETVATANTASMTPQELSAFQEIGPRKNIVELTPQELTQFRDAVRLLQTNGEWVELAGDHGVPRAYCPHGSKKFLPWHRRFIARLEIALGLALPYWDWTVAPIPNAFLEPTYVDGNGATQANPLLFGPKPDGTSTVRDINAEFPHKALSEQEALAISRDNFDDMSDAVEGAHNDVHGSVGGDMNTLDYSSFDPIFWLNHNNVDRIWFQWQLVNKFAMYPADARGPLKDSRGTFSGEDQIRDLSGWMRKTPSETLAKNDPARDERIGTVDRAGLPRPGPSDPPTPKPTTRQVKPTAPPKPPAFTVVSQASKQPSSSAAASTSSSAAASKNSTGNGAKGAKAKPATLKSKNGTVPINNNGTNVTSPESDSKSSSRKPKEPSQEIHSPLMNRLPGIVNFQPDVNTASASDPQDSMQSSVSIPLNVMERRFLANNSDPTPGKLQIPLNMQNDLIESTTRLRSQLAGYRPTPRVVCVLKDVKSTRDPTRIDVYMKSVRVGMVYNFGMGQSGMEYTMDRYVDVTIPHRDLLDNCDLDKIETFVQLQMVNLQTKQPEPTPQYAVVFEPMLF